MMNNQPTHEQQQHLTQLTKEIRENILLEIDRSLAKNFSEIAEKFPDKAAREKFMAETKQRLYQESMARFQEILTEEVLQPSPSSTKSF